MKVCSCCKRTLSFDQFNKEAKRKDGLRCYCKDCMSVKSAQKYQKLILDPKKVLETRAMDRHYYSIRSERLRELRQRDPIAMAQHKVQMDNTRTAKKKRYAFNIEQWRLWREPGCVVCGEREICCIEAHHLNPAEKLFMVGNRVESPTPWDEIARELSKCVRLCCNCHTKVHAGVMTLPYQLHPATQILKGV